MIRTFDYKCKDCRHTEEYYVAISSDTGELLEPVVCANCDSTNMKRLVSAPRLNWNRGPYEEFL